jgi:nucleotide-binding universal stress UspA family protein
VGHRFQLRRHSGGSKTVPSAADRRRRAVDDPKRLLVGVDGSAGAQRALEWAVSESNRSEADILAVYVLTYSRELANDLPPTGMTNWRRSQQHALNTTWTEALHDAGVAFECRFIEADSVDGGLLRVAEDEGVDLIVLGTHKSGSWTGRALGTIAGRVAHRSHCPVVLVPGT